MAPSWVRFWMGEADQQKPRGQRIFFSDLRPHPGAAVKDGTWRREDLDAWPVGVIDADDEIAAAPYWPTQFADLVPGGGDRVTRTAIGEAGVAEPHTLRVVESQPRGAELVWSGRIEAQHHDRAELVALAAFLLRCAGRVENLGGFTGSGYGVIVSPQGAMPFEATIDEQPVALSELEEAGRSCANAARGKKKGAWHAVPTPKTPVASESSFAAAVETQQWSRRSLVLSPLEPVCMLDRKRPDVHYASSREDITGAVLKGALAGALNRETGCPITRPIDASHPAAAEYPELCSHFEQIRFLHALPLAPEWAGEDVVRPLRVPLSAFASSKRAAAVWDAALHWDEAEPAPGMYEAFFAPDCDDLTGFLVDNGVAGEELKAYSLAMGSEVHVAIDPSSGAAAVGQLFGYDVIPAVRPGGSGDNAAGPRRNFFATRVAVPDDGHGLAGRLLDQIEKILPYMRIGKTDAAVRWWRCNEPSRPLEERLKAYGDAPVVITLVTDALLPLETEQMKSMTDMTLLYDAAWNKVWASLTNESTAKLSIQDVFARQELRGGWIGRRGRTGSYRAFCLTRAGSVFVTKSAASSVVSDPVAMDALRAIEERGVPLADAELTWRTCPYVPENGFGEVLVCPSWHLQRSPRRAMGNGGSL